MRTQSKSVLFRTTQAQKKRITAIAKQRNISEAHLIRYGIELAIARKTDAHLLAATAA